MLQSQNIVESLNCNKYCFIFSHLLSFMYWSVVFITLMSVYCVNGFTVFTYFFLFFIYIFTCNYSNILFYMKYISIFCYEFILKMTFEG